jgi:hypothetical protein
VTQPKLHNHTIQPTCSYYKPCQKRRHTQAHKDALRKPTHPPGDRSVSRVGLEFSYSAGVAAPWGEVEYHCTGRGLRGTRPAVYGRSALADHGRASLGAPLEALSFVDITQGTPTQEGARSPQGATARRRRRVSSSETYAAGRGRRVQTTNETHRLSRSARFVSSSELRVLAAAR